jgi:hypothetical protein
MGQYQQWLLAQEIDRRLKAEVETLETELLYLKDRVIILEQALPNTENVILQALLAYQRPQASQELLEKRNASSAPASWSSLTNMETPRPGAAPYYFGLHSEQGLLPGDMLAFFDQREQATSGLIQRDKAVEEHPQNDETQQQNENIRRWFERWHREILSTAQPEEMPHER